MQRGISTPGNLVQKTHVTHAGFGLCRANDAHKEAFQRLDLYLIRLGEVSCPRLGDTRRCTSLDVRKVTARTV